MSAIDHLNPMLEPSAETVNLLPTMRVILSMLPGLVRKPIGSPRKQGERGLSTRVTRASTSPCLQSVLPLASGVAETTPAGMLLDSGTVRMKAKRRLLHMVSGRFNLSGIPEMTSNFKIHFKYLRRALGPRHLHRSKRSI